MFQQSKIAEKLESGVEIVLNNRNLLPKPDLSDVDVRRTEFNAMRKRLKLSAFGSEYVLFSFLLKFLMYRYFSQFKRILLSALGKIIEEDCPGDYEPSKFMVRKNGNPDSKLKTALQLFSLNLE